MGTATVQAQLWATDPQGWAQGMELRNSMLYTVTLDALGPLDGKTCLDVGCGTGLALRLAAERGAEVAGLDACQPFVDLAQARTPGGDVRRGDIEELPFADDSFDVVLSFNAIQYGADPAAVVAELARVCRPGGRVAIGIWGDPSRCESEGLFARLRSIAPPPPGTPAPLACSDPGVVEDLLTKAGLAVSGGGDVPVSYSFTDHNQAFREYAASGPLQKSIAAAGVETVRTVIRDVVEADRKPDGVLRQDNVFRFVVATKPAGL